MSVATPPFIGFGSDLADCATSGGSYVSVGKLIDFDTPDQKVKDVETSYIQMASRSKLFMPGLVDNGSPKLTVEWDPAKYSHIRALIAAGTKYFFKITMPDDVANGGTTATTYAWGGYYKELSAPVKMEDMVVFDVVIKVSGDITEVLGT